MRKRRVGESGAGPTRKRDGQPDSSRGMASGRQEAVRVAQEALPLERMASDPEAPPLSARQVRQFQALRGNAYVERMMSGSRPQKPGAARTPTAAAGPTLQRFEQGEHKVLGDVASQKATIKLGEGLTLTLGDVAAVAGDYFESVEQIKELAAVPGEGRSKPRSADEIRYVLETKVWKTKTDADFGKDVVKEATKRYYKLAAGNVAHFTNPKEGDELRTQGQKAADYVVKRDEKGREKAVRVNNAGEYRENHKQAVKAACRAGRAKGPLDEALLYEAFASHFLTDAFAAGHVRTERASIAEWWNPRVPMFWTNLQWWMAENIANHINNNSTLLGMLTVQQLWEEGRKAFTEVLNQKGMPPLTFGDAVSGAVHDLDNKKGVVADVAGEMVRLVGEGKLLDEKGRLAAAEADAVSRITAAMKVSLKDIYDGYEAGKADMAEDTVLGGLCTPEGLFRAEQLWPKRFAECGPESAGPKWKVETAEQLLTNSAMNSEMIEALSDFARGKANTLESEIKFEGRFAKQKTQALKESVADRLRAEPLKALREIINYTPGAATGALGGVGGHDIDDNAVEYFKKAKQTKTTEGKSALATLTLEQRARLLRDVLKGATIGEEESMIVDLLTSNMGHAARAIDSVGWRWIYKDLGGESLKKFIRECGPVYWAGKGYGAKRAEVKYLADGRTDETAQETTVIILRTCTPEEVRRIDKEVGGWTGLSFDLTGKWDEEFRKMKAR